MRSSSVVPGSPPHPAAADSILFVRDGNVWISTPDGSTERPLTAGGGFSSPSMADDGTIVALRGRCVRAAAAATAPTIGDAVRRGRRRLGRRRAARSTRGSSPDGAAGSRTGSPAVGGFCLPIEPGCSVQDTDVTAYAYAGRVTDPLELGAVRDRRQPSWYGPGRALVFRHGAGHAARPSRSTASARGEADDQGWFSYDDGTSLAQGQLDPGGTRLAARRGREPDPPLRRQPAAAGAPGAALRRRRAGRTRRRRGRPAAAMLAWEQADGVHVAGPVPDLRQAVPDCSVIAPAAADRRHRPLLGPRRRAGRDLREAAARHAGGAQAARGRSARCGSARRQRGTRGARCGCASPAGRRASTCA